MVYLVAVATIVDEDDGGGCRGPVLSLTYDGGLCFTQAAVVGQKPASLLARCGDSDVRTAQEAHQTYSSITVEVVE